MEIHFTKHAKGQLKERGLAEEIVIETLLNPEQAFYQEPDVFVSQRRYRLKGKEYLIRVASKRNGEILVVLTAYRTSKISKYWRYDL
ncbi:MAG: hypothetical protein A4E52_00070 [Pelotomaculum sp. PtaB.Bin013]|uniref:DUF4258 domain-containing protein n=1 Tax=Pelotomaculum isophthalicicum JI TaxID=947010 RepID=A0A9X4H5B4_9FIRM|nr:DUF4258 domain-containing protein [Pelotomaculum isophthalicicum]MDF9409498.1 DUF4258 domain-containing protein [Pelotomaculum isophthalicicum JI]OPX92204.1 MAG: hypothetical protein A4E52_00070 [Pelotomaculum sp. PtaB.Bin013]